MSSDQESASRWLNKKITEAKGAYLAASLFTIVSAGCFVVFCRYLSEFAVAWVNEGLVLPGTLLYAAAFLTGRYLFAHFASLSNYNAGNTIVTKIKKEIYPLLLNNSRLDSTSGALYVTRISDDLKPYFAFFIPYSVATIVVSTVLLAVCFWVEKWVGFILLVSLIVIPVQMAVIGVGAEALHKKHTDLFLKYSAVFYNRLHTIAEIVNLDNFKAQFRFLSGKSKELNRATTGVMRIAILSSAVLELFVTICIAAVAIYLGMSLLGIMPGPNYGKGYDFRTALFLLTLTPYFFFYLRKFVSAYHDRNRALASAKLLMPVLSEKAAPSFDDTSEELHSFEIKKLNFAYPDSPVRVLHNIDLRLPAKGLVLVKGISGSGKSTLLKICAGSLLAEEGSVSVNGKENVWSHRWLKVNSSYMNQFPFIFDGTLRYNVFLENKGDYPFPDGEAGREYRKPIFGGEGGKQNRHPFTGGETCEQYRKPLSGGEDRKQNQHPYSGGETCEQCRKPLSGGETERFKNPLPEENVKNEGSYPVFLDKIVAKKEKGWQTGLSHNGKQLSGGERQLVTLARMMLHPEPIAILDEPTANLDADTVEIILPQIVALAKERLVIVASHETGFEGVADAIVHLNWGEQVV